jgi:capsular polysaccharide transport system permease protein
MNDFTEALAIQGRVLLALMLREARTRYGRQQIGYLWAIIEPMFHISILMVMFSFMGRASPLGESLPMFLATGIATYLGFRNVYGRTKGGYGSNEALLTYPVVKIVDVFLGRALLELATWIVVMMILISVLILLGHGSLPHAPLLMLEAVAALFCLGFSVGMCFGLLTEFVPSAANFLTWPMRILYFASGVFMLPDSMPPMVRDIIVWNPLLHGIALFREGYYRMYDSHMLDVGYLWKFVVAMLLVAFVAERMARRPIRNIV